MSTLPPIISVGGQWIVDASGCDASTLRSMPTITALCRDVIDGLGLRVIGQPQSHQFGPPGGVTALYLLSESHLAIHTYPEHQFATINLVCCRDHADWDWKQNLANHLGADRVHVRQLRRGVWG